MLLRVRAMFCPPFDPVPSWQVVQGKQTEDDQRREYAEHVHSKGDGQSDRGRRPDGRRGGEPGDAALLSQDHAGSEKPDSCYHARGNTGGIARADDMGGDEPEDTCTERHRRIGADAGLAAVPFAFPADERAEQRCHQRAQRHQCFYIPIHRDCRFEMRDVRLTTIKDDLDRRWA